MKWYAWMVLALFLAKYGMASSIGKEVKLEDCLDKSRNVYVVKITGSPSVTIKEFKEKAGTEGPSVTDENYYSATVIEIINKGDGALLDTEPWTMLFPPAEEAMVKKTKAHGADSIKVRDTIFIFDEENLYYTYLYYVEGMRKIVYNHYCTDAAAGQIRIGSTYLFISKPGISNTNGVFYGNIGDGLYPNTKKMRKKIAGILAQKNK